MWVLEAVFLVGIGAVTEVGAGDESSGCEALEFTEKGIDAKILCGVADRGGDYPGPVGAFDADFGLAAWADLE